MSLSFKETFAVGFSDFWARKLRTAITIFSIILGTMSIIVVQSMVKGINDSTVAWMMERGGMTRIDINRNWAYNNPKNLNTYLTFREFNTLSAQLTEAEYITPQMVSYGTLSFGRNSFQGSINGVQPDFVKIEEWEVDNGRFVNHIDYNQLSDVVVIGSTVKKELFGNKNPIGQYITLEERRLQVIGVMKERHFDSPGMMGSQNMLEYLNRRTFIPVTTMISKLSYDDKIENITVKAVSVTETPALREKVSRLLLDLRQGEPLFNVSSAQEEAAKMKGNVFIFQVVFFIISSISLLVAGIVIMNIMMASVIERTREIGIRLAVGANPIDIFLQFIIQTLIITTSGGLIGVFTGISLLDTIADYLSINMSVGFNTVIISLIISNCIGIIFGIFPAIKASRLEPVKCLAYQ